VGENVLIDYQNEKKLGTIYSKSSVANDNLEYKVIVHLSEKIELL
jgi:hypothetical protein